MAGAAARSVWRSSAVSSRARGSGWSDESTGVASWRAWGHHPCPVSDTTTVTRGLVTRSRSRPDYRQGPTSNGQEARQERVMNSRRRPGEFADSGEDDTEGQSYKARAVPEGDDTEGQSYKARAVPDERRHRGPVVQGSRRPRRATTPRASRTRLAPSPKSDDTEGQSYKARAVPGRGRHRGPVVQGSRRPRRRRHRGPVVQGSRRPRRRRHRGPVVQGSRRPRRDDTEGQSYKARAVPEGDDTEGQSYKARAVPEEDDTEGQSYKAR